MNIIGIAAAALCAAGICAVQPEVANAQPAQANSKHFRLTFVLTHPHEQQPSQTFVLDVPVTREHPGVSSMSMAAGLTGQVEESVQEDLQCSDVHESAIGLAANVTFVVNTIPSEKASGSMETRHRELRFEKRIDLVIGKPTTITEEMHVIPLGSGPALPDALAPAPQISVTATEL